MNVCLSWFSSSRLKVLDSGLRFSMPVVARTGTCQQTAAVLQGSQERRSRALSLPSTPLHLTHAACKVAGHLRIDHHIATRQARINKFEKATKSRPL